MTRTAAAAGTAPDAAPMPAARPSPFAHIVHDLRQPASAALLTAEFIEELLATKAPAETVLRQTALIGRLMRHTLRLTDDLLLSGQLEAGAVRLARAPTDVGTLLDDAARCLAPAARARGVGVRVDAVPLPPAHADGERLLRVLTNLGDNAIVHTPAGGEVRLEAWAEAGAIAVAVSDTGRGMDGASLAQAFDPYWRAEGGRVPGGVGLGLAIARHLVELHGGRISAANAPGGGLRVAFTVPTYAADAASPGAASDAAA